MARLQDFNTVTPTSSDKLLVVQSQGQGLVPYGSKLDSANPTGTGKLSMNRASGSAEGTNSVTLGLSCTASGERSIAEGSATTASGIRSHSEGDGTTASGNNGSHAEGLSTTASGINGSHAEGYGSIASGAGSHAENRATTASGTYSHAEGLGTKASRRSQHVFGEYNVEETGDAGTKGTYIEIVGKGSSATPSNARTLDWSGNETLAGGLKINGNQDVAVEEYKTGDVITLNRTAMLAVFETATELSCFLNTPKKIATSSNLTINTTYVETYIEGYDVNQTSVVSGATAQKRSDYQIIIKVNGNFTNVSMKRPVVGVLSGTITIP